MSEIFDYCHVAELTDRGCKRPANEDWLAHFESPNGLVAVVCDGMGGHVGGQVASHVAVDAIKRFMMQEHVGSTPGELIVQAIDYANRVILNRTAQQPELTGMGSTCVMLIVRNGKVYIGSVGDSRIYLIRNHTIRQLTVDQSYVQMLVDAGQITKEQAEHHPRKNEITNALGLREMQPATVLPDAINPEAGDCFLLCSDGLSGMVPDRDICKTVSKQSELSQQERVAELVERAKQNGGLDNITCQIVEFSVTPGAKAETSTPKKKIWTAVGIVAGIIVIAGIVLLLTNKGEDKTKEQFVRSEEMNQIIQTSDSVIDLKKDSVSIKYEKGKAAVEFEETEGLGVIINIHSKPNKKLSLPGFTLKNMKVLPDDLVDLRNNETDSLKSSLVFKDMIGEEAEIGITLSSIDGKSQYVIVVPVTNILPTDAEGSAQQGGIPQDKTERKKEAKADLTKLGEGVGKVKDAGPSEGKDSVDANTAKSEDGVTFKIGANEQNKVLTLHAKKGTPTDNDAYFEQYSFDTESNAEKDCGWYKIKNDGATCVLTIKNTNQNPLPKDAVIKIPTKQNVTIKVIIKKKK